MQIVNWVFENAINIAALLSCVWSTLLVVAKLTPSKADDVAIEHMQILGGALFELIQSLGPDESEEIEVKIDAALDDAEEGEGDNAGK